MSVAPRTGEDGEDGDDTERLTMSEEQEPSRHRLLPGSRWTRRRVAAAAALVALGLVAAGAVVLTGPADPGPSSGTADAPADPPASGSAAPAVDPTPSEPATGAPSGVPSGAPSDPAASGSSASEEDAAKAEEAADDRSNALAKLAEEVAKNSAVPDALTFRVGTLNLLGASHTAAGGDKAQYASGAARVAGAIALLNSQAVDVVGLQEFEGDQKSAFTRASGGAWQFYTGSARGRESIAWRTSVWSYVEGGTRLIPYFHGNLLPMPWVLLENVATGRRVHVISIHNPTSSANRGNNNHWRDVATSIEIDWAADLHQSGYPVLLTGDFNEKVDPFCRTTSAGMVASNGGTASPCIPPARNGIDWIFGTPELTFSDHARLDGGTIDRLTDHPFIVATATYDGPVPRG